MLRRLRVSYGLTGVSLQWFTSYLLGRTQQSCMPAVAYIAQLNRRSSTVYRKRRSSGQSCFIPPISSLDRAAWSSAAPIRRRHSDRRLVRSVNSCSLFAVAWKSVLPTWPAGCHQTGSNSTHRKRNWCGVPHKGIAVHLVPTDGHVIGLDAIKPVATVKDLGCTWTLQCLWGTTSVVSRQLAVLASCGKSDASFSVV